MSAIVDVIAREILDSRGNPTDRSRRRARVGHHAAAPRCRPARPPGRRRPSNCATATLRATAARACMKAVENVNTEICEAIIGLDATEQAFIDQTMIELDGTREQVAASAPTRSSRCRARSPRRRPRNPSLPLYRYLGGAGEMQLPVPQMNVINGGAHANNKHRHAGVHARAGRRADASARRCATAPRCSTR